jgi:CheY-like chemotaxis protein
MEGIMAEPKTILLADDDSDDVELTLLHFKEVGFTPSFEIVGDGQDVVERLEQAARGRASAPDLVVMDLRMPRLSGDDVLRRLAGDPLLPRVPIAIMTSSGNERDEERCLALGAKAYLSKPSTLAEYRAAASKLASLLL